MAHNNDTLPGVYFDCNAVINLALSAGKSAQTMHDLLIDTVEGQQVSRALQGAISIDTSLHVITTSEHVLQNKYGWDPSETRRMLLAFIALVKFSDGVRLGRIPNDDTSVAENIVPRHLHKSPQNPKGVDKEDFRMLTGALLAGSRVVLTDDKYVLGASTEFARRRGVLLMDTAGFSKRRIG